jgi:hypothetical protein
MKSRAPPELHHQSEHLPKYIMFLINQTAGTPTAASSASARTPGCHTEHSRCMLHSVGRSPAWRARAPRPARLLCGVSAAAQLACLPRYDPRRLERALGLPAALPILTVIRLLLAMSLPRLWHQDWEYYKQTPSPHLPPPPASSHSMRCSDCLPEPTMALRKLGPAQRLGRGRSEGRPGSLKERGVSHSPRSHSGEIHQCEEGDLIETNSAINV